MAFQKFISLNRSTGIPFTPTTRLLLEKNSTSAAIGCSSVKPADETAPKNRRRWLELNTVPRESVKPARAPAQIAPSVVPGATNACIFAAQAT
jgi:hypothetical protein